MIVVQSTTMITTWIHASIMLFLFINKKLCMNVSVSAASQVVSHMAWLWARSTNHRHAIATHLVHSARTRINVQIKCNEEKCVWMLFECVCAFSALAQNGMSKVVLDGLLNSVWQLAMRLLALKQLIQSSCWQPFSFTQHTHDQCEHIQLRYDFVPLQTQ